MPWLGNLVQLWICGAILVVVFLCVPRDAAAIPIQLTSTQFSTAIAGHSAVVEDFEAFSTGGHSSPFTLANGTYTATAPFIITGGTICPNTTQCLADSSDLSGVRTLSGLPAGTTLWGVDIGHNEAADAFDITVVGGSGTLFVTNHVFNPSADFIGFADSQGLVSVSFQNLGHSIPFGHSFGAFGLDNVTTAPPVPEPATMLLLGSGLAGLAGFGRRRKGH